MTISLHLQSSDHSTKRPSHSAPDQANLHSLPVPSLAVCLCLKPSPPQSLRATNPLLRLRPSGIAGSVAPESVPVSVQSAIGPISR